MSSPPSPALPKMPAPALNGWSIAAAVGAVAGILMFGGLAAWSHAFPPWLASFTPFILHGIYKGMRDDLGAKASRAKDLSADLESLIRVCLWHPSAALRTSLSSKRDDVLRCVHRMKALPQQDPALEELMRSFEPVANGIPTMSSADRRGLGMQTNPLCGRPSTCSDLVGVSESAVAAGSDKKPRQGALIREAIC